MPDIDHLERTLEIPSPSPPASVSREELVEFIRCIAEGIPPIGDGRLVQGQRAIELAAWDLYRRLQEEGEL